MIGKNLLLKLRNSVTGLNATTARFDILQNKMDEISISLKSVADSVNNLEKAAMSQPSLESLVMSIGRLNYANSEDGVLIDPSDPAGSINAVAGSLNNIYRKLDTIKKFAFLVHDPMMLVHYADVWRALGPSSFIIVLTEYFSADVDGNFRLGESDFYSHVDKEGYEVRKLSEIISCGIRFEYVVTNHIISGSTREIKPETADDYFKKLINRGLVLKDKMPAWDFKADVDTYLPLQIGDKQIRYMYGADISDGWSLQGWNDIYDVFLCHGVNDEREIRKRFEGKTFIMGYPRYDRFFSEKIDLNNIRREFRLDESKKTVLWMPTLGGDYSSIPLFAELLSMMTEKYNFIVRPHPLSFVKEKEFIDLLEKFNFNIDKSALRDMNELFGVADVILVDNGGTPFSAIFLRKNLIFLDVPDDLDIESAETSIFAGSSVMELKKYLPSVSNQEFQQLQDMLDSEEFYTENNKCIDMLFTKYFDSPRGDGGKRVAEILKSL